MALCCEKLGYSADALRYVQAAGKSALDVTADMCAVLQLRLNDSEYLKNAEYGRRLMEAFEKMRRILPNTYAQLHLPWIEEWYIANRQYQCAYKIMKESLIKDRVSKRFWT